jgi:hypothetical protein
LANDLCNVELPSYDCVINIFLRKDGESDILVVTVGNGNCSFISDDNSTDIDDYTFFVDNIECNTTVVSP